MTQPPAVTVRVIVPTFNRARLLEEALSSVLAQEFSDFEVVVADDASADDTEPVVRALARRDRRVRYLKLPHGGVSAARNAAIAATGRAEFYGFLDSDDCWHPWHLDRAVAALRCRPGAVLAFSRAETVDVTGGWTAERLTARDDRMRRPLRDSVSRAGDAHVLDRQGLRSALLRSEYHPHPSTVVVRSGALGRGQWFNPGLSIYEDCELFIRLAAAGEFLFLDDQHARVRYHGDNLSGEVDFESERALPKLEQMHQYALWKLAMCDRQDDQRVVRMEIEATAYFLAQYWAQRVDLGRARAQYLRGLRHRMTLRSLRGLIVSTLPPPVYTALRARFARAVPL